MREERGEGVPPVLPQSLPVPPSPLPVPPSQWRPGRVRAWSAGRGAEDGAARGAGLGSVLRDLPRAAARPQGAALSALLLREVPAGVRAAAQPDAAVPGVPADVHRAGAGGLGAAEQPGAGAAGGGGARPPPPPRTPPERRHALPQPRGEGAGVLLRGLRDGDVPGVPGGRAPRAPHRPAARRPRPAARGPPRPLRRPPSTAAPAVGGGGAGVGAEPGAGGAARGGGGRDRGGVFGSGGDTSAAPRAARAPPRRHLQRQTAGAAGAAGGAAGGRGERGEQRGACRGGAGAGVGGRGAAAAEAGGRAARGAGGARLPGAAAAERAPGLRPGARGAAPLHPQPGRPAHHRRRRPQDGGHGRGAAPGRGGTARLAQRHHQGQGRTARPHRRRHHPLPGDGPGRVSGGGRGAGQQERDVRAAVHAAGRGRPAAGRLALRAAHPRQPLPPPRPQGHRPPSLPRRCQAPRQVPQRRPRAPEGRAQALQHVRQRQEEGEPHRGRARLPRWEPGPREGRVHQPAGHLHVQHRPHRGGRQQQPVRPGVLQRGSVPAAVRGPRPLSGAAAAPDGRHRRHQRRHHHRRLRQPLGQHLLPRGKVQVQDRGGAADGPQRRRRRPQRPHHRGGQQGLLRLRLPGQREAAHQVRQPRHRRAPVRGPTLRGGEQQERDRGHRLSQPLGEGVQRRRRVPVQVRLSRGGQRAVQRPDRRRHRRQRKHHRGRLGQQPRPGVRRGGVVPLVHQHGRRPPVRPPGPRAHARRPRRGGRFRQPLLQGLSLPAVATGPPSPTPGPPTCREAHGVTTMATRTRWGHQTTATGAGATGVATIAMVATIIATMATGMATTLGTQWGHQTAAAIAGAITVAAVIATVATMMATFTATVMATGTFSYERGHHHHRCGYCNGHEDTGCAVRPPSRGHHHHCYGYHNGHKDTGCVVWPLSYGYRHRCCGHRDSHKDSGPAVWPPRPPPVATMAITIIATMGTMMVATVATRTLDPQPHGRCHHCLGHRGGGHSSHRDTGPAAKPRGHQHLHCGHRDGYKDTGLAAWPPWPSPS